MSASSNKTIEWTNNNGSTTSWSFASTQMLNFELGNNLWTKYLGITPFIAGFWYKFLLETLTMLQTPILMCSFGWDLRDINLWWSRSFRVASSTNMKKQTDDKVWEPRPFGCRILSWLLKIAETTTTPWHWSIANLSIIETDCTLDVRELKSK